MLPLIVGLHIDLQDDLALIGEKERHDSELHVEALGKELIQSSIEQLRTFKVSNRNKRLLIDMSVKVFDMLVKYPALQKTRVQVTQESVISKTEIITEFVDNLPSKLREQVLAYVRKRN